MLYYFYFQLRVEALFIPLMCDMWIHCFNESELTDRMTRVVNTYCTSIVSSPSVATASHPSAARGRRCNRANRSEPHAAPFHIKRRQETFTSELLTSNPSRLC